MKLIIYNNHYILEKFYPTIKDLSEDEYFEEAKKIDEMIESGYFEDDEDDEDIRIDIINCFLERNYRVVFCFYDYQLDWSDKEEQEFIKKRTLAINQEWPYIIPKPRVNIPETRWYEVKNTEELKKELQSFGFEFTCAIVSKDSDVNDLKYILNVKEDTDFDFLHIVDKSNGDFLNIVVPKLKNLLKNKLEIIDKR